MTINNILKVSTLVIASTLIVSCSSKSKDAAGTTAATTKQDAKKVDAKAKKAAATATSAGSLVCKSGSDTRSIDVIQKDGGCELSYTKFNETTTPATSANGTAHCESVKEKIKGNLESAGFTCE